MQASDLNARGALAMITLRGFCLVLLTVLMRHFTDAEAALPFQPALLLVVAYCIGFCVLSKASAVATSMLYPAYSRSFVWQKFEFRRSGLEWLWIGCLPWAMSLSGFGAALAAGQTLGWPHALVMAAWFAPSITFLFALDFSTVQLEHLLIRSDPASRSDSLAANWWMRVRLGTTGGVVMCVVPVLWVLTAIDTMDAILPWLSETVRGFGAVTFLALTCLTVAPFWMRTWVAAEAVPKNSLLAGRLVEFSRVLKVPAPRLFRIRSRGCWQGAALVGWTRLGRQMWLGDSAVELLSSPQLDMVLLHELAHLQRGHCWWRLFPLLGCGLLGCGLWGCGLSEPWPWLLLGSLSMLYWLGCISRFCELDADRVACRTAQSICQWAEKGDPKIAAQMLVSALVRLHGQNVNPKRRYWLHPSLATRATSLGVANTCQAQME